MKFGHLLICPVIRQREYLFRNKLWLGCHIKYLLCTSNLFLEILDVYFYIKREYFTIFNTFKRTQIFRQHDVTKCVNQNVSN